ncbi:MAG: rRNA maturation RNase YbeY [Fidelibacterota bacterium]
MHSSRRKEKHIHIYNESGLRLPLRHEEISGIIFTLLKTYRLSSCDINIIYMADEPLRDMKKEYFDQDVLTDIISFTLEGGEDYVEGELYISLQRIRENASRYHVSIRQECARILIHGFLHLMGYEDGNPQARAQMTALENRHLEECGYA